MQQSSPSYPSALPKAVKSKLVGDFSGVHRILDLISLTEFRLPHNLLSMVTDRKILLVCEDQEQCISKFIFVQHSLQFLTSLNNTVTIVAINNEDDALSVLEVMPP